jgi:hypothetical protein
MPARHGFREAAQLQHQRRVGLADDEGVKGEVRGKLTAVFELRGVS